MASEKDTTTVQFLSKYHSLKIVRKPMRTKEIEGQLVSTEGASIRFSEGVFETSDPEEIAFIEARPEFKNGIIVRVPGNVKDLVAHQARWEEDLEAREKRLAEREAALARKEAKVNSSEEGSRVGKPEGDEDNGEDGDGLDDMKRADLVAIADELEIPSDQTKVGTKNADIVALIRAKRAELASGTGQSTGGDSGAAY